MRPVRLYINSRRSDVTPSHRRRSFSRPYFCRITVQAAVRTRIDVQNGRSTKTRTSPAIAGLRFVMRYASGKDRANVARVTKVAIKKVRPKTRIKTAWSGGTPPIDPWSVQRKSKALRRKNEVNRFVPARIAAQLWPSPRGGAVLITASLLAA